MFFFPFLQPAIISVRGEATTPTILWVVGGPGSNKAALCQRAVAQRPGWTHYRYTMESDQNLQWIYLLDNKKNTGDIYGINEVPTKVLSHDLLQI